MNQSKTRLPLVLTLLKFHQFILGKEKLKMQQNILYYLKLHKKTKNISENQNEVNQETTNVSKDENEINEEITNVLENETSENSEEINHVFK